MNRMDWDRAYPPTPQSYHDALRSALSDLEEKSMKRRYKAALALAAALLGALLIGTAALAAINHWGVLDFFKENNPALQPLPGSEHLIEKDLGSAENGTLRLTIREAMYDGVGVRVVAAIEPVDPARFQVMDSNDEDFEADPGLTPIIVHAARLSAYNAKFEDGFAELDEFDRESHALIYGVEYLLKGEAPKVMKLNLALPGDSEAARLSVDFEIQNRAEARTVKLTPRKAEGEDFRIVSAEVRYTQVAAYLDVTYQDWQPAPTGAPFEAPEGTYYVGTPEPGSPRDLDFALLDEAGKEIAWSGCGSEQMGDEVEGMRTYHQTMMLQTSRQLPSKLYLEPTEFWRGKEYEPIECEVG